MHVVAGRITKINHKSTPQKNMEWRSDAEQMALEFEEALDMKLKKKDRSKVKRHQLAAK